MKIVARNRILNAAGINCKNIMENGLLPSVNGSNSGGE